MKRTNRLTVFLIDSTAGAVVSHSEFLPLEKVCRKRKSRIYVILSASEESRISCRYEVEILRLSPQDDRATQSPTADGLGHG